MLPSLGLFSVHLDLPWYLSTQRELCIQLSVQTVVYTVVYTDSWAACPDGHSLHNRSPEDLLVYLVMVYIPQQAGSVLSNGEGTDSMHGVGRGGEAAQHMLWHIECAGDLGANLWVVPAPVGSKRKLRIVLSEDERSRCLTSWQSMLMSARCQTLVEQCLAEGACHRILLGI